MSLKGVSYLSAVSVFFALNLGAQSAGWSNVKSITPGAELRVAVSGGGLVQGSLQGVTEDSVMLNSCSGRQTLGRQEVIRVSVKKKGHRKRNALIGLAGGTGVGLGVGLAARCTSLCLISTGQITAVTTVAGALIGTIVGIAIPTGGWREIYKQSAHGEPSVDRLCCVSFW